MNNADTASSSRGFGNGNQHDKQAHFNYFSDEQYRQILSLLNKVSEREPQGNMKGMAGIATCLMSQLPQHEWIIDSGATHHIITNLKSLEHSVHIDASRREKVQLPTEDMNTITHTSNARLFDNETVKGVLYVPEFRCNLLSVAKVNRKLSCFVTFYPDFYVFQNFYSGRVKGINREKNGLYMMDGDSGGSKFAGAHTINNSKEHNLWHMRLGHPSQQVMKQIPELNKCAKIPVEKNCHICPLAKQTRLQFPISNSRFNPFLKLVHLDLWGPYNIPTYDKKYYFLTIVDDHTRFTWVYMLQLKSEVVIVLKQFLAMIRNQFGKMIKVLRSDNRTEFFNSKCSELYFLWVLFIKVVALIPHNIMEQ